MLSHPAQALLKGIAFFKTLSASVRVHIIQCIQHFLLHSTFQTFIFILICLWQKLHFAYRKIGKCCMVRNQYCSNLSLQLHSLKSNSFNRNFFQFFFCFVIYKEMQMNAQNNQNHRAKHIILCPLSLTEPKNIWLTLMRKLMTYWIILYKTICSNNLISISISL